MISESVASHLESVTGDATRISISTLPRNFNRLSVLEGKNVIVSDLEQLISLPLRIRRIQYEPTLGDDSNFSGVELDGCINNVINAAAKIIQSIDGEERSLKWSRETYMLINRIIAGSGPRGILNGTDAITRINHRDDLDEVIESLEFQFHDGYRAIASRRYKYGVQPTFFDDFEAEVDGIPALIYSELLFHLQSLCEATDYVESNRFQHLFVWSDSPLNEFQSSLVNRVLDDCLHRFQTSVQHSAKVLLFCSIPHTGIQELLRTFNAKEKLALSRAFGNGVLYLAPGSKTDVYTDPKKTANRPESVLNSEDFTKELEQRMDQIRIDEHRVVNRLRYVVHESTNDLVEKSAFVFVADCWTGTWNQSKEIDGEQVL